MNWPNPLLLGRLLLRGLLPSLVVLQQADGLAEQLQGPRIPQLDLVFRTMYEERDRNVSIHELIESASLFVFHPITASRGKQPAHGKHHGGGEDGLEARVHHVHRHTERA